MGSDPIRQHGVQGQVLATIGQQFGVSTSVIPHNAALYLRSICMPSIAFRGLRCHPLTCIMLKLRLSVDSSPT